ncbi:unnamed protein product, partial [Discosporangium mesarthrocarpum]
MCTKGWGGDCDGDTSPSARVFQVAFYSFQVSAGDVDDTGAISLSIMPECNNLTQEG